jgi:hypothetical protein
MLEIKERMKILNFSSKFSEKNIEKSRDLEWD